VLQPTESEREVHNQIMVGKRHHQLRQRGHGALGKAHLHQHIADELDLEALPDVPDGSRRLGPGAFDARLQRLNQQVYGLLLAPSADFSGVVLYARGVDWNIVVLLTRADVRQNPRDAVAPVLLQCGLGDADFLGRRLAPLVATLGVRQDQLGQEEVVIGGCQAGGA
jgi:hypothetical protein